MITNFSDETLSALHASVLPHYCHPDSVFHFQKSLTAHLYLCYEVIGENDILGFLFPVSCILYPNEIITQVRNPWQCVDRYLLSTLFTVRIIKLIGRGKVTFLISCHQNYEFLLIQLTKFYKYEK